MNYHFLYPPFVWLDTLHVCFIMQKNPNLVTMKNTVLLKCLLIYLIIIVLWLNNECIHATILEIVTHQKHFTNETMNWSVIDIKTLKHFERLVTVSNFFATKIWFFVLTTFIGKKERSKAKLKMFKNGDTNHFDESHRLLLLEIIINMICGIFHVTYFNNWFELIRLHLTIVNKIIIIINA